MNSIPIVFGEALFDTFPDGQRVLGGAPFNVAWHLGGFGLKPLFVSRVGDDGPGRELLARMSAWGLETRAVQRDPHHPTGNVQVRIANDQPSFEIEAEQAYDYIDSAEVREVVGSPSNAVLYHGSLAIRSDISRQALETIATPEQGIVCDLNLRPPWWTRERVRWCLDRAAWMAGSRAAFAGCSRCARRCGISPPRLRWRLRC